MHTNLDNVCLLVSDFPELGALLSMSLKSLGVDLWHRNRKAVATKEERRGSPGHSLIILVYKSPSSPHFQNWMTNSIAQQIHLWTRWLPSAASASDAASLTKPSQGGPLLHFHQASYRVNKPCPHSYISPHSFTSQHTVSALDLLLPLIPS